MVKFLATGANGWLAQHLVRGALEDLANELRQTDEELEIHLTSRGKSDFESDSGLETKVTVHENIASFEGQEMENVLKTVKPDIVLLAAACCVGYIVMRRRRRRRRINELWQRHIQDSSYDAFLDTPPPHVPQQPPHQVPQQRSPVTTAV